MVEDGEVVSYDMLGLGGPGPHDVRSDAEADDAPAGDNRQTEEVPKAPNDNPIAATAKKKTVQNQDTEDKEEPKESDEQSKNSEPATPTQTADDSQQQTGPADDTDELKEATSIDAPTQIRPQVDPTADTQATSASRSEVSDQFLAWVDAGPVDGESNDIETEFDDEAPALVPQKNNHFYVALGIVLLLVCAIWILLPAGEESTPRPLQENPTEVAIPNTTKPTDKKEPEEKEDSVKPTPAVNAPPAEHKSKQSQTSSGPAPADPVGQAVTKPDPIPGKKPQKQNATTPNLAPISKPQEQRKQKTKKQDQPGKIASRKKPRSRQVPKPTSKAHQSASISKGSGTLRINSEPFSVVYWKKKRLGPTPQMAIRLPAGSHTLTLKNEALGIEKRVRVRIENNKVHTVFVELGK